ncbi:hypothetical protein DPEC_G00021510 [Dallia pectoralis]|uniref:Uncharacterized protein n=1 Tax=Dallia pectoralis TaxID=75939 RepID=A0ACC2HGX7_DALPE|nr:hypothetical protein DPEC_G00021510 [Dallia pectoralis]
MSKLTHLNVFVTERLTSVAAEISEVFERTVVELHEEISRSKEENDRLRRLLDLVFHPENKVQTPDLQHSLHNSDEEVHTEQQYHVQEWSPNMGQEDPYPTQVKEDCSKDEEQLQCPGQIDMIKFISPPACEQENPSYPSHSNKLQPVEYQEKERSFLPTKTNEDIKREPDIDGYAVSETTIHILPLSERLTSVAAEISEVFERTVVELHEEISRSKEENDRLRRLLDLVFHPENKVQTPDPQHSFHNSDEEVHTEQQYHVQEWSPNMGQEDPYPTQVKEDCSKDEEQLQCPGQIDMIKFISPPTCEQENPSYPSHSNTLQPVEDQEKERKLNKYHFAVGGSCHTQRLNAAATEISIAVETTVAELHEEISRSKEEINRLRELLNINLNPKLHQPDYQLPPLPRSKHKVPHEQQFFVHEWSPNMGEEGQEPILIKEEEEELTISQEEEQLKSLFDIEESISTPPCVKNVCDLENRSLPSHGSDEVWRFLGTSQVVDLFDENT